MILDLFGLISVYASGSCRDLSTSIYAMALAAVVLVYVVIHVFFSALHHQKDKQDDDEDRLLEKRHKPDWPTEIRSVWIAIEYRVLLAACATLKVQASQSALNLAIRSSNRHGVALPPRADPLPPELLAAGDLQQVGAPLPSPSPSLALSPSHPPHRHISLSLFFRSCPMEPWPCPASSSSTDLKLPPDSAGK
ncbi:hypothetical protein ZWY2020_010932 [Hordeum vulgare]|nr:hypothetical protein ZWY2020_010932 [Hordeum vulgare]